MCIPDLMFVLISEYFENSPGCDFTTYTYQSLITNVFRPETILNQTNQNGYPTVSFGVYIHDLMLFPFWSFI